MATTYVVSIMQTKVRGAMQMTGKGPTFPIAKWEEHARKVQVYDDLARAISAADLSHRSSARRARDQTQGLRRVGSARPPPWAPRDQQLLNKTGLGWCSPE